MSNVFKRSEPKIGDSKSLWNFSDSPGWTKEEIQILQLLLMKHGIGQWSKIIKSGLLPGKLNRQLNLQTQRLLGQQSSAIFTGLKLDIDKIRSDNEKRTDVKRKGVLIINNDKKLTKEIKRQRRNEALEQYGLSDERLEEIDKQLNDIKKDLYISQNYQLENEDLTKHSDDDSLSSDIMTCDARLLSKVERNQLKQELLEKIERLKRKLSTLNYSNIEILNNDSIENSSNSYETEETTNSVNIDDILNERLNILLKKRKTNI